MNEPVVIAKPQPKAVIPADKTPPIKKEEKEKKLSLFFVTTEKVSGGANKGISDLYIKLEAGGKTCHLKTNYKGQLPIVTFKASATVCTVKVKLPTGAEKSLEDIVLEHGHKAHTYISTLQVAKGVTEPHKGEPPKKPDSKTTPPIVEVGAANSTRSEAGNPVIQIGADAECYDKENAEHKLKLGLNVVYRKWIIAAAKKIKFLPQAVATMIYCEAWPITSVVTNVAAKKMSPEDTAQETERMKAAKAANAEIEKKEAEAIAAAELDTTKKGINNAKKLIKQTKENVKARSKKDDDDEALRILQQQPTIVKIDYALWDKNSKAPPPGTASGLTQFLAKTWLGEAIKKDNFLFEKAVKAGCVLVKKNTKKQWETPPLTVDEIKKNNDIEISNKSAKKKLPLIKPKQKLVEVTAPDTYVVNKDKESMKKLYDMRFDPEISIMALADYAVSNIAKLSEKFPKINDIKNDGNKAKLAYLGHHLGPGDAPKFIRSTLSEARAEELLRSQKGKKSIEGQKEALALYVADHKSWVFAHRRFLINYMDGKIKIQTFACEGMKVETSDSVFDIVIAIGGVHPEGFVLV